MNKNKKVLIIDDEPYIRRVIELKLKASGYQVITAPNGVEGLNCFKKYKYTSWAKFAESADNCHSRSASLPLCPTFKSP